MKPPKEVIEIVERLLEKSKAGQVDWHPAGLRNPPKFEILLPNSRVLIDYQSPKSDPDFVHFELHNSEKLVFNWIEQDGGDNWDLLSELYAYASGSEVELRGVINEIREALELEHIGLPPEENPSNPDKESADEFYKWASGEWLLKYTGKGKPTKEEKCVIGPDGTYYINNIPCFALDHVDYVPNERVSFSKRYLPTHPHYRGPREIHHREILTIPTGNAMVGHRDGVPEHKLDYTRANSSGRIGMFIAGK